jgi:hypothetical protein
MRKRYYDENLRHFNERLTCWASRRHVWDEPEHRAGTVFDVADGDQVLVLADFAGR